MKTRLRIILFISVLMVGAFVSVSEVKADCQFQGQSDTSHPVELNRQANAPSIPEYAVGDSLTATVKTKPGFNCDGFKVQFTLSPDNGNGYDSMKGEDNLGLIPVSNGVAVARVTVAQFYPNATGYRIKATSGVTGGQWQYFSNRFTVASAGSCVISNFSALQSGDKINFNVTANSFCESKDVNIELLIQSSNLGTSSGGKVASGKITNGKFSGSWPLDTSLGTVYFKACVAGATCQTSTISGAPPGGSSGGCGTSGQPDCKPGETQIYSFNIENPLKGGASDFTSLVKILAQWIFNLAIPIAVAMIVYSGILFLTAAGDTTKVTKARDVLKYAVIGLAIILIGSGFVTLIQSILELGGTTSPSTTTESGEPSPPTVNGAVGNKCSKDSNCFTSLTCKNTICQRATGNLDGEPCAGATNCASGLDCNRSDSGIQEIDGQTLGTCSQP